MRPIPSFFQVYCQGVNLLSSYIGLQITQVGAAFQYRNDISSQQNPLNWSAHQYSWHIAIIQMPAIGYVISDDLQALVASNASTSFVTKLALSDAAGGSPDYSAGFSYTFSGIGYVTCNDSLSEGGVLTRDWLFAARTKSIS